FREFHDRERSLRSFISEMPHSSLSRGGHTSAAVVLGFILVLGVLGNFLLLLVFSRFPGLRTPANLLLINISVSDMLVCLFGTPLSLAASVRGRWLTGTYGCRWYGFCNALFGIVSLVSLSLLSFERYTALLGGSQLNSVQDRRARLAVAVSWFYSLVWTLPPLLGWSSYGPEGPGTICSVQWQQRSLAARSYVACLFVFCLLLPLLLMVFCYGKILYDGKMFSLTVIMKRRLTPLIIVLFTITGYLLCWIPYGVVAMLASFEEPGVVPPAATLVPSLLAKTSTVLNPVICGLLNNQTFCSLESAFSPFAIVKLYLHFFFTPFCAFLSQFSRCFLHMISCSAEDSTSSDGVWSSRGIWPQNMQIKEQNTEPATLPSRDHHGRQWEQVQMDDNET
uniref:Teleost multiple tissue opsin 3b n=1 Tax=Fundulus heteroclitus TaxID=8078 RepID=A0A3Q2TQN7_FUNHE